MREKLREVLELQRAYSSRNTPAMMRRGELVRREIVEELRAWPALSPEFALPFRGALAVQGSDGVGSKTFVPWVRIYSPELSRTAQNGWYVVFLFRTDGAGVALCLSHGSTTGIDQQPRSPQEAARLMSWARGLVGPAARRLGMADGVELGSAEKLSRAYESTTAFSKTYRIDALATDDKISSDVVAVVGLLGELYRALELGREPSSTPPEIAAALEATAQVARPDGAHRRGQGFGLTAAERAVVEAHAMQLAEVWLSKHGYDDVRDVHRTSSCDFIATKDGKEVHIEVKGTTSAFGSILLTANEVELHKSQHPNNVLIVVHDIDLLPLRTKAIGGDLKVFESWDVTQATLRPLSFECVLNS